MATSIFVPMSLPTLDAEWNGIERATLAFPATKIDRSGCHGSSGYRSQIEKSSACRTAASRARRAVKASWNLWLSEQKRFRKVLPHFCRVKTAFERR
jgi:hypothetical protein